jgi:hypothetical protein
MISTFNFSHLLLLVLVESFTSSLFILRMASNSQSIFDGTSSNAEAAIRSMLKSLSNMVVASIDFE